MDMLVVNKTLKEINLERTTLYEEVGTQMEAVKQELEKNAAIHKESMSTFKELPMSKATSTSVLLCSIPSTGTISVRKPHSVYELHSYEPC